jgi:hypothetical protein
MKYFLEVRDEERGRELLAFAYGDVTEINFLARRQVAELAGKSGGSYSFRLLQVSYVGQDIESDDAVKLGAAIGDGETVAGALKAKLLKLKKSTAE